VDGEHLLVNTLGDRQKGRNLRARSQVALDMVGPDNPFRYLAVRGRVVELTEEGAAAQIDGLALRYLGTPYPRHDPARLFCNSAGVSIVCSRRMIVGLPT
jgi:hypothetical protein